MHYYTADGSPQHTVVGKNGKERATSIADARKLKLFPSVTTVMSIQDKPALTEWLTTQLLDAVILNPFHPQEWDIENYKKVMRARMREVGNKAAERGTEIHKVLDGHFTHGAVNAKEKIYVEKAIELIYREFGDSGWKSEGTFCSGEHGYAGSVDLYNKEKNVIIDFKTKDKFNLEGVKQYDDHKIQLAAYQNGLGMGRETKRYNLFISTHKDSPGECKLIECKEYDKFISLFLSLLEVWKIKNNYNPGE